FGFILSWNEYLFASVLLTGEARKTVPIGIAEFIVQFDIRWGEVMAASSLATIPVVILFAGIQRHFVRGPVAGALKGGERRWRLIGNKPERSRSATARRS